MIHKIIYHPFLQRIWLMRKGQDGSGFRAAGYRSHIVDGQ